MNVLEASLQQLDAEFSRITKEKSRIIEQLSKEVPPTEALSRYYQELRDIRAHQPTINRSARSRKIVLPHQDNLWPGYPG